MCGVCSSAWDPCGFSYSPKTCSVDCLKLPVGMFKVQGSRFFICHLCLDQESRHIEIIFAGFSESTEVQNKHTIIIIIIIVTVIIIEI